MIVKGKRTKTLLRRLLGEPEHMMFADGFRGKDIKHIEMLKAELKRRKVL